MMALPYPILNLRGETVEPTGHIKERIGAGICAAKPSFLSIGKHAENRLSDPMGFFLFTFNDRERAIYEQWSDNLLVALDKLGLQIVEGNNEPW